MDWQGKGREVLTGKQREKAAAMSSRCFYSLANQKDVWWPKMSFPLPRVVPGEEDNPLLLPYSPSAWICFLDFRLGSEFQIDWALIELKLLLQLKWGKSSALWARVC